MYRACLFCMEKKEPTGYMKVEPFVAVDRSVINRRLNRKKLRKCYMQDKLYSNIELLKGEKTWEVI